MSSFHQPVLLSEVIHYLKLKPGDKIVDCTLGGGGHAQAILSRILPQGKVLGIDLDPLAIKTVQNQNQKNKNQIILAQDNFKNLKQIADVHQFNKINGILLDLGLSSGQLQDQVRGFSFLAEGPLDMRFGRQTEISAGQILNTYSQKELAEIFKNFGEERLAKPISEEIIETRQMKPIGSPQELMKIVSTIYQRYYRGQSKVNPATKIFQALRIEVNDELGNLRAVLPQAAELLTPGGRILVISYHSLEDRMVKDFFRQEGRDCICPPELPTCRCRHHKTLKTITKKPVLPTREEITINPRSRSAKLRVAEKI